MDFASLMKTQINKGKTSAPSNGSQKYLKRSEVEAQREAAYLKEQEHLDRARKEKAAKKRKLEDEEAECNLARAEKKRRFEEEARRQREEEEEREERERRERLGLPDLPPKDKDREGRESTPLAEGEEDIEEDKLLVKLRELGEPTKLFGETHVQRLHRYKRLTGASIGPKIYPGPIPTTLQLVEEKDMKVPLKIAKDAEGKKYIFRQLVSYFTMLLTEWESTMARRPLEVKDSYSGKLALNAMVQARDNLRPFFRKMEKSDIEDTVLEGVLEIVHAAQERKYVDANNGYLRLSIGKAAWPIGVTMVGIHERSAREKLHESDNTAHIMSDETTRKYLQSIKRCLSFAQTRWPPDDQLQLMG
jgi:pre-mRNA-splicing factor 18